LRKDREVRAVKKKGKPLRLPVNPDKKLPHIHHHTKERFLSAQNGWFGILFIQNALAGIPYNMLPFPGSK
jgi:hypothetical protein